MAGRHGLIPIHDAMRAIERDFPAPQRYLYFPTLLWFSAGDLALRFLTAMGLCAAVMIAIGGQATPLLFCVCWVVLLSLDRAMVLIYPWDSVLFEAIFWATFLPATKVGALAAVDGCAPAVLWAYRLLTFRVMFGFGKHKFLGATRQDSGFLQGFFASMPLPNRIGWLVQKSPLPLLKFALWVSFVVEVTLPFGVFFPGFWSALFGLATMLFMTAIWSVGNFGIFNLLISIVSLSCFDSATASRLELFGGSELRAVFIDCLFVLHTTVALMALPFNTFCSFTWMMWSPFLRVRPRWLCAPIVLVRALQPFRFAHAYGVFSPRSDPAVRMTAVAEVTWDDTTWHELEHPFWPTHERSTPKFCAPHHERFDQAVLYESLGITESSPYRNIIGRWDPYGHGGVSSARLFMRRVLLNDLPGTRFYDRTMARRLGPPRAIRVRLHMLEPATVSQLRVEGRWWRRTLIGPHYETLRQREGYWEEPLPPPELWHYDDLIWLRRSRLGELMRRAQLGEDADTLVLLHADNLTDADTQTFWNEFVPLVHQRHCQTFRGMRATVTELRERYGAAQLQRFERIANRYALLLFARLEPAFLKAGWSFIKPDWPPPPELGALPVRSFYELRTLCMATAAEGKVAYSAMYRDLSLAVAAASRLTMYSAHQLQVVFRYETFVFHAGKLRLFDCIAKQRGRREPSDKQHRAKQSLDEFLSRCWGSVPFIEFLKTQFDGPEDQLDVPERWPAFEVTAAMEIRKVTTQAADGSELA
ncbi:MAG TPA: lipase maturation factor family protein [Polyangiales bacterium]|nr:lipase maturation factor family protein [Polyangiales bacterium]